MKNTRMLVEGAFMLTIFIVLLLLSIYVPLVMIVAQLFLILPFLLYSAKYPMKYAVLLTVAAVIFSFMLGFAAVPFAVLYGTTGLMMGYGIRLKKSKAHIFLSSSLVFLINIILFFAVAAKLFHLNFMDEFAEAFRSSSEQYSKALESFGQKPDVNIQAQLNEMLDVIMTLIPSLLVGTAFITVLVLMLVNFPIMRRLGLEVPRFQPFRLLRFPKAILFYYLVTLIVSIAVKLEPGTYWYMAVFNAANILQILLVIQGMAFIFYFSHLKKWPVMIPIIAIVLLVMVPVFLSIVRLLGIIDLGFDLRQRLKKN